VLGVGETTTWIDLVDNEDHVMVKGGLSKGGRFEKGEKEMVTRMENNIEDKIEVMVKHREVQAKNGRQSQGKERGMIKKGRKGFVRGRADPTYQNKRKSQHKK